MPDDELLEAINKGQHARLVRHTVEESMISREEDIIQSLVREYDAGTLTNDKLRGSIGQIVELRRFRTLLEVDIRRGKAAAEVELGVDDAPESEAG